MGKIYYQLYSGREYGDMQQLLSDISAIGYQGVEPFGAFYDAHLDTLKQGLSSTKMGCDSGHFNIHDILNNPSEIIAIAKELGMTYVIIPFIAQSERPQTPEEWKTLAQKIEQIVPEYQKSGLKLGYHNHDFEFFPCSGGSIPMDILLKSAPSLLWEADVAWIFRAKHKPLPWLQKYKDRIAIIHVKDVASVGENLDEDGWADVGKGVLDWENLFNQLGMSFVDIWIVEHDKPASIMRNAKDSYQFIAKIFES